LGGGPPCFPQGFTCPAVLRVRLWSAGEFQLQGCYLLWPAFPGPLHLLPAFFLRDKTPYNPDVAIGLGCSPFARRYLGNRTCFLFLRVLRCFSSPGLPPITLWIQVTVLALLASGFPHSEISGSRLTYSSPKHIGVRPVLLRLLAPRHPPCALSSLSTLLPVNCNFFFLSNFQGAFYLEGFLPPVP
jgi:hypothetical protein